MIYNQLAKYYRVNPAVTAAPVMPNLPPLSVEQKEAVRRAQQVVDIKKNEDRRKKNG
jgi:hypothetical protein